MKKIIYLLVGIVLFGGLYYSCVPEELPGSIYGTVVDKATGEPIKVAGVELSPSGLKTVTGSEGQFEFTELDPGKYTLLITKTGYIDGVSHTIEVKPGQQAKGDVQIEKLPPALKVVNDNREEISILDFGSAEDDVARSFSVFNDGTETLEWELTATADWIKSVSKTTGALSAGATQAIIITIDRAKLSSGENKTTVHITSNSGNKQLVITATNNFQVTKLNVLPTTAITSTSATLNGEIVEDGSPIYTERGFVYAETTQPTISACIQKIAAPFSDSKTFAATVSDLAEGKKYYVRAYAIQSDKEVYSVNEVSFVTNTVVLPSVVTSAITNVGKNSATTGGNVTNDGGASVTERGVVYSLSANPSLSDLGSTIVRSGSGTGSFTCELTNLQAGTKYYVRAYAMNSKGTAYGTEVTFTTNKQPSSGNGTENGYAYVDLGLSVKWATMNVGASKAEDYGDYFAWGETTTKDTYNWSTYKWCNGSGSTLTKYCNNSSNGNNGFTDNKTQLELSDDAAHANWGGAWRMPTDAELTELREQCTWTWTTQNGVNGYKVTSKSNGNSIFLPAAGSRYDSSLYDAGSNGYYWSSSLGAKFPVYPWGVYFSSGNVKESIRYRYLGQSVRPVCP